MGQLVRMFMDIALRKRGPQDLPASGFLFGITLAAYFTVDTLYFWLATSNPDRTLRLVAIDLGLMLLWFWFVLVIARRRHRYQQTVTALLGTGALIGVFAVALQTIYRLVETRAELAQLPAFGLLALLIWSLVIVAHILRNALDIGMAGGVGLATLYLVTDLAVFSTLPEAAG